ncbi:MAG: glycosyltransferase [Pseudobutyrivibrio sp.]|nr:glycosyltransferase [Pseudobutyrivibrio sp.]
MCKLSIIVISYNEAEYLPSALDSIINQNYEYEYEIIIGDDGSTDGSINIIKKYEEEYPMIHHFVMSRADIIDVKMLIPSIRATKIVKKALENAKGEYVKILSGDDFLLGKDILSIQTEFLDKNLDYASCYSDYKWVYKNGDRLIHLPKCSNEILWAAQYIHISCFMFRNNIDDFILERFADDIGLVYSIYRSGKSGHIDYCGFGYRQREKSIMHKSDRLEICISELMVYQDILNKNIEDKSTRAHFSLANKYVYFNRKKLKKDKYKKYIENCAVYDHDIIGSYIKCSEKILAERVKINIAIDKSIIYRFMYTIKKYLSRKG